ncbi:ferredoxin reductase family protein [Antarctobacter heliothermus]|uniref:Predicted ferric reductase n=1 Tax=Antarctobacter heliothermus TaxID=74033 RepID=A0A239C0H1_9RHOB|nr:ferredoxin reductase family protein [Antarctobacter heliothermus]SNS13620.1 Predicted ferric reductase [Antarctobacter heliothermus]
MPAALLVLFYLGLTCAPLVMAAVQGHAPRPLRDELASGVALAGLAIILVEFVLSGRFRVISGRIGMDVTMRLHQLLARAATVMILLHPYLYAGPQSLRAGLTPPGSAPLNFDWLGLWPGIVAWLLLGALMVMALGRNGVFRHEHWRAMHGIMALIVAGFGVLHATRAGRYSADPALAMLWWGLFAVAAFSLLWVYVIKPAMKARRPWRVSAVSRLADRTWELCLSPVGHKGLRYRPGHFAWISVGKLAVSLDENPFSIASAPADGPDLRFVIKELGDFTSRLGEIKPGTPSYVDAPFGSLTLDRHRDAAGVALIAGGVGIAPMLSHLRQLDADADPRPRLLLYANRTVDQIVCGAELDARAKGGPLQVTHVLSEPPEGWTGETGFVTAEVIQRHFAQDALRTWVFVLCGPPPMLHAVEKALMSLGVAPKNILLEQFSYD